MSLRPSRIDIIFDGMRVSPFTHASNPPLLAVISFLDKVLKPRRLNCTVGKDLSCFVSFIARKSAF